MLGPFYSAEVQANGWSLSFSLKTSVRDSWGFTSSINIYCAFSKLSSVKRSKNMGFCPPESSGLPTDKLNKGCLKILLYPPLLELPKCVQWPTKNEFFRISPIFSLKDVPRLPCLSLTAKCFWLELLAVRQLPLLLVTQSEKPKLPLSRDASPSQKT